MFPGNRGSEANKDAIIISALEQCGYEKSLELEVSHNQLKVAPRGLSTCVSF